MAYQVPILTEPPLPLKLANARTFQELREATKEHLMMLGKYHYDSLNTVIRSANQNFQGAGADVPAASTVTITQPIHTVTGTATISNINAPKGFQGGLILASKDGFSLTNTGNIRMFQAPNFLDPGAYVHLTYHPNEQAWYADTCRLQDRSGGGGKLVPAGTTVNTFLQWLATGPEWSTATLPLDVTTGDLLYGSAAHVWSRLADVAAGSYLRSGGAGAAPVWSTLKLPNAAAVGDLMVANPANTIVALPDVATGQVLASGGVGAIPAYTASPSVTDVTASGTVQTATLNVTTHVTQAGGLKHQRVTTGAVAASSNADVTLTWTAAFADANYTVTVSVMEAGANLEVVGIKSTAGANIVVTVKNTDAGAPHTGTLMAIALHD